VKEGVCELPTRSCWKSGVVAQNSRTRPPRDLKREKRGKGGKDFARRRTFVFGVLGRKV